MTNNFDLKLCTVSKQKDAKRFLQILATAATGMAGCPIV